MGPENPEIPVGTAADRHIQSTEYGQDFNWDPSEFPVQFWAPACLLDRKCSHRGHQMKSVERPDECREAGVVYNVFIVREGQGDSSKVNDITLTFWREKSRNLYVIRYLGRIRKRSVRR